MFSEAPGPEGSGPIRHPDVCFLQDLRPIRFGVGVKPPVRCAARLHPPSGKDAVGVTLAVAPFNLETARAHYAKQVVNDDATGTRRAGDCSGA